MNKSKTFENKVFENIKLSKVTVFKDEQNDLMIRSHVENKTASMVLSAKTALELATWILDNVSEVEK